MKRDFRIPALLACILTLVPALCPRAADLDLSKLPPPAVSIVDFDRDIKPIFETSCLRCHGPEKPRGRLRLDNRESAFKGGQHGEVILPGHSEKSSLVLYVARLVEDMEMPPNGKGDPLTPQQVALLRAWIDQGAAWPESSVSTASQTTVSVTPAGGWVSVRGNKAKFREQEGIKDGATGGVESFSLTEAIDPETRFTVDGRALYDANDYRIRLALTRNDVGFVRGGFDEWRKYSNDVGGYYALLNPPAYRLGRDLHVDFGRAWFDLGLTLRDWPRMTLGYEYQFKRGLESTLQWGPVGAPGFGFPGPDARNIYPGFRSIDERVQILKFDLEHDWLGWHIEDNFRYEFLSLKNSRDEVMQYTVGPVPDNLNRITEYDHQRIGANSFHIERQFTDWLQAAGGYYYSGIRGNSAFTDQTLTGANSPAFGPQYFGNNIILKQDTHALSASGLLGPWKGWAFSSAVQSEWTRQEGFGNPNLQVGNPSVPLLFADPITLLVNLVKYTVSEEVGMRYTAIPHTVLFAESRFRQVEMRQFQEQDGSFAPFTRDTAAYENMKEATAGITVSPWQPVSFTASYRHSARQSDFNHLLNQSSGVYAYPAFIRWRDIVSDEIAAKLVLRPSLWFRATLGYELTATDYTTATASFPAVTPGGPIYSGNYDAQTFSVSTTLTPWKRLFFTDTLSYSESRLSTGNAGNGAASVVPSRGGVYSAISTASFVMSDATDLTASYSFSHSDFGQHDLVAGLPAGTIYTRHGVEGGIRHRFRHNISSSLLYTFYRYREPSSGTFNDYVAHGIFASVTLTWP
jgi:hypothetical protein